MVAVDHSVFYLRTTQLPSGHTNALAEPVNGLYKTGLINRQGPWRTRDDIEFATFERVDRYNHRRIHGSRQNMPPVEYEAAFHTKNEPADMEAYSAILIDD